MKYIVVKDEQDEEHAIIFPDSLLHRHVGRIHRVNDVRVISAGFCSLNPISTWGESESLHLNSRPEDTAVLEKCYGEES